MNQETKVSIDQLVNDENIIFQEKFVTAYYAEDLQVIGLVWDGMFSKNDYIDTFKKLLKFGETHKTIGFYSDIRKQGVVNVEARKYFEKHITPEAAKQGINKTGVVSDASPFKKYYLNTIIKMTNRPAKICSDPNDALEYILS